MTAARPLPFTGDDLDVFPMDDAYLASLPQEIREAIQDAERRIADGTSPRVPHADVVRKLEEQRPARGG